MKVVINRCYGAFGLSDEAKAYMNQKRAEMSLPELDFSIFDNGHRNYWALVEAVETLGEKANGFCSKLKVVEVPNDVMWEIKEYDGLEEVREVARVWY